MTEFTDARTINWALISSPIPLITINLVYLYIVLVAGPRFMKDRQPYLLKKFIQCYNIFQIIANFCVVLYIMIYGKPFAALWRYCESFDELCDYSTVEKQLAVSWWILLLKITDLSETIIFVLRKKHQQISVLHLHHHISMTFWYWMTLRYFVHSFMMSLAVINGIVHVIMYSYYFLTTVGSHMQQKLQLFKKWITIIQMVQIAIILIFGGPRGLTCSNKIAKYLAICNSLNGTIMFSFFWNFYRKSYKKLKEV